MRATTATALAVALILALPSAVPAAARDEYPKTGAAAMAYYESDADRWLDGPAEYLILDEEGDTWNELATTEQRASFIARFWERRENERRDQEKPFKVAFYERVAYANTRYRDTPFRGWKSDRGRIAVTLGLPDSVRAIGSGTGLVWTYYTFGAHAQDKGFSSTTGRVEIAFVSRGAGRNEYRIASSQGAGIFPRYVLHALDYSRQAAVGGARTRPVY